MNTAGYFIRRNLQKKIYKHLLIQKDKNMSPRVLLIFLKLVTWLGAKAPNIRLKPKMYHLKHRYDDHLTWNSNVFLGGAPVMSEASERFNCSSSSVPSMLIENAAKVSSENINVQGDGWINNEPDDPFKMEE